MASSTDKIKDPESQDLLSNYSEYMKVLGLLPNPYFELRKSQIYKIFRSMRKYDGHIKAAVTQRLFSATKTRWEIEPASDSAEDVARAEFINNTISDLETKNLFYNLLIAIPDGFSVCELGWTSPEDNQDSLWNIAGYKHLFPELFGFQENGDLILKESGHSVIAAQPTHTEMYPNLSKRFPYKFVVHTNTNEFSDPAGVAVLAACFWPWTMKKAGLSFWNKMLARFGVPSIAALYSDTGSEAQKKLRREAISEALLTMAQDSTGAFNDIDKLMVLDTDGNGDDFLKFTQFLNNEISKAFLTETLTLETQGTGSYALGEIHLDILAQIVEKDVRALSNTINKCIIEPLYRLNWGDAEPCKIVFNLKQKMDVADVIKLMELGVPISVDSLKNDYYAPIADPDQDSIVIPTSNSSSVELSLKKKPFNPYL